MRHRSLIAVFALAVGIAAVATTYAAAQASSKWLMHARRHAFAFCELQKLWTMVGPARYAHTMARIATAESGGLPWVSSGSAAGGLWQIQGRAPRGDPYDPGANARMAVWKLRVSHWRIGGPWAGSRGLPGSGYSDAALVRRFGRAGFGHCGA
jgi:hypothetical protein